jgi:hypothetical protein
MFGDMKKVRLSGLCAEVGTRDILKTEQTSSVLYR